jgi:EmrB/QacA subfamily drug resistance transporter
VRARRRTIVLLVLACGQLMLVLDVTVVNVALPDIAASLELGPAAVPWVMTAYTLAFGGLMLLGGRICDVAGARRTMTAGLVVFTAASLLCGLATGPAGLLAGRGLQGLGAALLSPAALALVLRTHTGASRAGALAVWGTLSGAGTALGVVLGGLLTSTAGWRWIFIVNVPISALVLLTVPLLVASDRGHRSRERLDLLGAALVTAGTGAAIYGAVNVTSHGWTAASTLLPLALAPVLYVAFAYVEDHTPAPLLRVGLLVRRPVAAGAFLMLVATGLMVGDFLLGSFALQRAHGYGAVEVGVAFLPVALAVIIGARAAGHVLTRMPANAVAAVGLALAAAGQAVIAAEPEPPRLVTGIAVAALGIGMTFVTAFSAALADVEPATAGLRSAVVNTFHELGGAFGVAVLSTAAGAALAVQRPRPDGFAGAFTLAAAVAAVAAVVALVLVPAIRAEDGHAGHH